MPDEGRSWTGSQTRRITQVFSRLILDPSVQSDAAFYTTGRMTDTVKCGILYIRNLRKERLKDMRIMNVLSSSFNLYLSLLHSSKVLLSCGNAPAGGFYYGSVTPAARRADCKSVTRETPKVRVLPGPLSAPVSQLEEGTGLNPVQ